METPALESRDPKPHSIAFIGTGIMGAPMAGHLLAAGYPLHIHSRTQSKAMELIQRGARWHDRPGDAVAKVSVVITMLGHPYDVEVVYLAQGGIIERAPPGAILIDMTTSSPELAQRIHRAAATKELHALDAPVSGGDIGAREARLSIMVGGDRVPFEAVLPILKRMGSNISLQGGPGCGQHTKMCNQIVVASTLMGVCEGLAYAKHAGLNPDRVLQSIGSGAAGSFQLNIVGSRILASNFAPGFLVEHFVKDLRIAEAESQRVGLDLPGLTLVKQRFDRLAGEGAGREGTQALYKLYDRMTSAFSGREEDAQERRE